MRAFMDTELGRSIGGVAISIALTLAVLLPVAVMEICAKLFHIG